MPITKSQLIQQLQQQFPDYDSEMVDKTVHLIIEEISHYLIEGKRVELRGFGSFSVREREPRKARNPKNGEAVKLDTRYSLYFRAGKELKDALNQ
jgi:integration host factor subunit beta